MDAPVSIAPSVGTLAARESALCLHCRTPLSAGERDFCCKGCRHVYELVNESGLARYYALRGDAALAPVSGSGREHDEPWLELMEQTAATSPGVRRVALDVQGLQCGACVWLIEALFKREPGALRIDVNPALGTMTCLADAQFPLRSFVHTIEDFGYKLGPARKTTARDKDTLLLRTGVCAAIAGNAMLLSATTYVGLESGPIYDLVMNASFVMATLSALIGGSYFVDRAWQGLKRRVLHLDLPIAIGMGLAYAGSVWSLYFGGGNAAYLDTVSVFIALMLFGRLLQERLVEKNRRQLLASDGASGLIARRVKQGRTELVPCTELAAGDELLVCPGEIVPVRAKLSDARAECALDWINGESEPRPFVRGDELVAGAINAGHSALRATAECAFERSDLDALLRDDDTAKRRIAGDFWDLVSRIYVVAVLVAAAGGALLWYALGGTITQVLDVTTAVLVVTCPCAFGIATPLAYELGVSALRKAGLFVRDGSFFDRAEHVRRIVFDKTGTLTTGALELRDPHSVRSLSHEVRSVLYDLSARSNHPKSAAIARALLRSDESLTLRDLNVIEVPGAGMESVIEGARYRLGEPSWALGSASDLRGPVLAVNGVLLAELDTVEISRPDAVREAEQLTREGYELWIASGDGQERVTDMAAHLAIPQGHARGDLSPEGKRELIAELDHRDTLMIGDGINDGPALSRALCSGTPAVDRPFVPARADFYFLTPGLSPIRTALRAAREVRKVIKRALVFAIAYNVLAVGLSYAGLMRPWLAAILMPASSLLVLTYTAVALSPRRTPWRS